MKDQTLSFKLTDGDITKTRIVTKLQYVLILSADDLSGVTTASYVDNAGVVTPLEAVYDKNQKSLRISSKTGDIYINAIQTITYA